MILVNITFKPHEATRTFGGRLHRALIVIVALVAVSSGIGGAVGTSVWVENRSSEAATFFVAHAGSDGLRYPAVVANVLGWGHEANHASKCSPGDYDDTLYDVPSGASVRLLIDETGRPSVSLAPETPGLPRLVPAPLGPMPEDERCQYIDTHR